MNGPLWSLPPCLSSASRCAWFQTSFFTSSSRLDASRKSLFREVVRIFRLPLTVSVGVGFLFWGFPFFCAYHVSRDKSSIPPLPTLPQSRFGSSRIFSFAVGIRVHSRLRPLATPSVARSPFSHPPPHNFRFLSSILTPHTFQHSPLRVFVQDRKSPIVIFPRS